MKCVNMKELYFQNFDLAKNLNGKTIINVAFFPSMSKVNIKPSLIDVALIMLHDLDITAE